MDENTLPVIETVDDLDEVALEELSGGLEEDEVNDVH